MDYNTHLMDLHQEKDNIAMRSYSENTNIEDEEHYKIFWKDKHGLIACT